MDEGSGSTAYDSRGSQHGTITSNALDTFHTIKNDVYIFTNNLGRSDTYDGILIPRNEQNTSYDAAGGLLEYTTAGLLNTAIVSGDTEELITNNNSTAVYVNYLGSNNITIAYTGDTPASGAIIPDGFMTGEVITEIDDLQKFTRNRSGTDYIFNAA